MPEQTSRGAAALLVTAIAAGNLAAAAAPNPAAIDWQPVGAFEIARTETTVAQFRAFVRATGTVTLAERRGGGEVCESGWVKKSGWTWRAPFGHGHARAGSAPAGVNGLFDMGGNAWEWVDDPPLARDNDERRTRGGSWWYGAAQMQRDHHQAKPADTAVVYIGFRCARQR
jgi:formylglycine-generating enzyme required for sulfatase activity